MANQDSVQEPGWLWHVKNITRGKATVIYANSYGQAGWWLPGGRCTQDYEEADRVCRAMNEMMRAN